AAVVGLAGWGWVRSVVPLPKMLLSPGSGWRRTAVESMRPVLTMVARPGTSACSENPQLVNEPGNSQDHSIEVGSGKGVCDCAGAGPHAPRTTTKANARMGTRLRMGSCRTGFLDGERGPLHVAAR